MPAIDDKTRAGLESLNWSLTDLVPGGGALAAKPRPGTKLEPAALTELAAAAAEQVTSLSLDDTDFTDEQLSVLTSFPNLNRLRLNGTRVSARTVASLASLRHLESLNLYDTGVDDEIFSALASYPSLRRLYLWQSAVTPAAATAYAEAHPKVAVDTGISTPAQTSKK